MKTKLVLFVLISFTFSMNAQLRFANECSKYKTDNSSIASNDSNRGQNVCSMPSTAYIDCLCEVEKHNDRLYKEKAIAQEEFNKKLKRNELKFRKAELLRKQAHDLRSSLNEIQQGKDYYHRTETTLTSSYTDFEGIFNSRKESAIRKLYEANRVLNTAESTYYECVKINMGNSDNCSNNNPYSSTVEFNKTQINQLYGLSYAPEIKLVINSDSKPYDNAIGNGKSDKSESKKEDSKIDPKFQREYNIRNEVSKLEQSGNYLRASQIKNANPDIYNYEERQISNIQGMAQSAEQIFDALADAECVRCQEGKKRIRKKAVENLKDRVNSANKFNNSYDIPYEIRNDGKYFGIFDLNKNQWATKPKYREIIFSKIDNQKYIFKATTKSLSKKTIKLN